MDRLEVITSFALVVNTGGFTAAAKKLGVSRAAVSKHISQLEAHLGAQLLNRTTRRVSPTEVGYAYYERCSRILEELREADSLVTRLQEQPRGVLKVNAPMSFGTLHLAPTVAQFMARYPDLHVHLELNDRFVDLLEGGFDVGVRIGNLEDSSLIARHIAPVRRLLCAAPQYLETEGVPRHPRDLSHHRCLHYGYFAGGLSWKLTGPGGEVTVAISPALCANNGEILREVAVQGLGIALLPTFIVGPDLALGRLRPVLAEYSPPEIAIHVIYPPSRHLSAKVRAFIDFLVDRLGNRPYWDAFEDNAAVA
jgi:DNA-binding transcriptional LysR family regulator